MQHEQLYSTYCFAGHASSFEIFQQEDLSRAWFCLAWKVGGLSFLPVELNTQLERWRRAIHNGAVGGKLPVQFSEDLFSHWLMGSL